MSELSPSGSPWDEWQPVAALVARLEFRFDPKNDTRARTMAFLELHGAHYLISPDEIDSGDFPVPDGKGLWIWEGWSRASAHGEIEYDGQYRRLGPAELANANSGSQPVIRKFRPDMKRKS